MRFNVRSFSPRPSLLCYRLLEGWVKPKVREQKILHKTNARDFYDFLGLRMAGLVESTQLFW